MWLIKKFKKTEPQKFHKKTNDMSMFNRLPTMQDSLRILMEIGIQVNTVIDVGILFGTQPLIDVFPHVKHHLFEPVDLNFKAISENYKNIEHELHHIALSDKDETVYLACISAGNDGKITHSSIVPNKVTDEEISGLVSCNEVRSARLDSFLKEWDTDTPFLLKIDVDGYEMPILKGATEALKNCSIVVIEAPLNKVKLPHFFERSGFLIENGFYMTDIVDLAYYDGILWQADLIFVRKELVDNIDRLRPFETKAFKFERDKWSQLNPRIN